MAAAKVFEGALALVPRAVLQLVRHGIILILKRLKPGGCEACALQPR